jgi:hypothetical protein
VRRDIIGRRYLTAVTAVEAPAVVADPDGAVRTCFEDLVVARGYADVGHVRYHVRIIDESGRLVTDLTVPAQGARTCLAGPDGAAGYRVVAITTELGYADGSWRPAKPTRIHLRGGKLVGLERDD